MKSSLAVLLSAVVLASLVACSKKDEKLTEIVLSVDANLAVPQQVDEVEIVVTGPSGQAQRAVGPLTGASALKLPLTLSLTSDVGGAAVGVRVAARFQGEEVVVREAKTSFVDGQSRLLGLALVRACLDVTCAAGQTCGTDGKCAAPDLAPDALPPFTGHLPDPLPSDPGGAGVAALGPGEAHTCVRTTTDRVMCWGSNDELELGVEAKVQRTAPRLLTALEKAEDLSASVDYTCARTELGDVYCWGINANGQLGIPASEPVSKPSKVEGLPPVVQMAAGEAHACALDKDGNVWCWGKNARGQLGDGTTADRATPAKVPLTGPAAAVGVGEDNTCAVLVAGTVQCWGSNEFGALGDGVTDGLDSPTPVTVKNITDAKQVKCGAYHACALRNQRVVSCWGRNNRGQLGDNRASGDISYVPVDVVGLSDTRDITLGELHSCARSESGIVTCWGANEFGQVGDGSLSDRSVPVPTQLGGPVDEVASGMFHVCARKSLGVVRCWGQNDKGQLGDGTTDNRPAPVVVIGLP